MKPTEVILLLSGGIDSTTLLAQLNAEGKLVHALSFDYGQRHAIELSFAKQNAARYKVTVHHVIVLNFQAFASASMLTNPDTPVINYQKTPLPAVLNETYVPGRNLLMLSHAAAYAEAKGINDIYFAANGDDEQRFPDCSTNFVNTLNQVWKICPNTDAIKVHTPFIHMSKTAVIQQSIKLDVNLQETISCYAPFGDNECETCLSCVLKKQAINEAYNVL